jgi:hypothetical protein
LQSAAHLKILTTILTTFTAWSRVLFEKVIGSQLVKKFPAFYETRRFITARNEINLMRYLSLVYSGTIPVHVSGFLVSHHQEVTMCICKNGMCCMFYLTVPTQLDYINIYYRQNTTIKLSNDYH